MSYKMLSYWIPFSNPQTLPKGFTPWNPNRQFNIDSKEWSFKPIDFIKLICFTYPQILNILNSSHTGWRSWSLPIQLPDLESNFATGHYPSRPVFFLLKIEIKKGPTSCWAFFRMGCVRYNSCRTYLPCFRTYHYCFLFWNFLFLM